MISEVRLENLDELIEEIEKLEKIIDGELENFEENEKIEKLDKIINEIAKLEKLIAEILNFVEREKKWDPVETFGSSLLSIFLTFVGDPDKPSHSISAPMVSTVHSSICRYGR